jgi:hypothetical protein
MSKGGDWRRRRLTKTINLYIQGKKCRLAPKHYPAATAICDDPLRSTGFTAGNRAVLKGDLGSAETARLAVKL